MGLSMNNILYASLAGLAVTMLYLLVQLKRVQKEVERSHQVLDSKCNRLNTMIQSYGEETNSRGSNNSELDSLPEALNVESELKKEIEALEQKELNEEALEHEEANRELENLEDSLNEASNEGSADNKGLFSDIPFELELYQDKNLAAMEDEPEEETRQEEVVEATSFEKEEVVEETGVVEESVEEEVLEEVSLDSVMNEVMDGSINYYDLTVKELKQIASDMNLRVGGTKPELVQRIQNAVQQ